MSDRAAELERVCDRLREYDAVEDAYLVKSFTDRVLIVAVRQGESLPASARDTLTSHGLRGANEVYGREAGDGSFAGAVGDATRHQFVDVRTRGDHQSYVLD